MAVYQSLEFLVKILWAHPHYYCTTVSSPVVMSRTLNNASQQGVSNASSTEKHECYSPHKTLLNWSQEQKKHLAALKMQSSNSWLWKVKQTSFSFLNFLSSWLENINLKLSVISFIPSPRKKIEKFSLKFVTNTGV